MTPRRAATAPCPRCSPDFAARWLPRRSTGARGSVLRLPEPAWVDVEVAESALARARAAGEPAQRLVAARESAALLEAGLLPGHEAEWLREARDATERVRVEALEVAARGNLAEALKAYEEIDSGP